jgi:isoaspartyl peptidase/L-asparaginase-like protein (Ntn-hydrolase superfamily)
MDRFTLVVHGGAWAVPSAESDPEFGAAAREGLLDALDAGGRALRDGGRALEAVVAAVEVLEDCPVLNAGRGSVLNAAGEVELDAALMEGSARRAGAVAGVRRIEHPIAAARAVLDDGRHVLLTGEGAESFAQDAGLALVDPASILAAARRADDGRGPAGAPSDTVGAVALDVRGGLAAATSTGGTPGKLPGRVSDSALVGSGTWADDATCAVSGTGLGEYFIRTAFARGVDALMRFAACDLPTACERMLAEVAALGGCGGCIAIDGAGRVALAHDTPGMPRGVLRADETPRVAIHPEDTIEV